MSEQKQGGLQVLTSGTEIIRILPTGEKFKLSSLHDWDKLDPMQQTYLSFYTDSVGQKVLSRTNAGVSEKEVKAWENDPVFAYVMDMIDTLLTEGLKSLDFMDSLSNSKIRGRVISARESGSYVKKEKTTNNLNIFGEGGLSAIMKALAPPPDAT